MLTKVAIVQFRTCRDILIDILIVISDPHRKDFNRLIRLLFDKLNVDHDLTSYPRRGKTALSKTVGSAIEW